MGRYFEKYDSVEYPVEVLYILGRLNKHGKFNGNLHTLNKLWRIFSEKNYCAGFLNPDETSIKEFADWLDTYEEDI